MIGDFLNDESWKYFVFGHNKDIEVSHFFFANKLILVAEASLFYFFTKV